MITFLDYVLQVNSMTYNIESIFESDYQTVEKFCDECKKYGWVNNQSLDSMKFYETLDSGGWLGIKNKNDDIISIAGYHHFNQIGDNCYRIFYRTAALPTQKSHYGMAHGAGTRGRAYIKKYIDLLPKQRLFTTTNHYNSNYPEIKRYHDHLVKVSKRKNSYINYVADIELFGIVQSVWEINIQVFLLSYGIE